MYEKIKRRSSIGREKKEGSPATNCLVLDGLTVALWKLEDDTLKMKIRRIMIREGKAGYKKHMKILRSKLIEFTSRNVKKILNPCNVTNVYNSLACRIIRDPMLALSEFSNSSCKARALTAG